MHGFGQSLIDLITPPLWFNNHSAAPFGSEWGSLVVVDLLHNYSSHSGCAFCSIRLTYSLAADANRPEFKAVARLIKETKPTTASTLSGLLGP